MKYQTFNTSKYIKPHSFRVIVYVHNRKITTHIMDVPLNNPLV